MESYNILADDAWNGKRIDKALADYFDQYSRSFIKGLFDDGHVLVKGKTVKPSCKVTAGDVVDISVPELETVEIVPENIPLDIVYEDEDIIIVNKPKDMVVHPAPGHYSGTLVNALMYHCGDSLSGINGEHRPGIVHRIDKDTTGLLVVCKNDMAHKSLAEQLANHTITRKYFAICYNHFGEDNGTVEGPIGRHPNDRKRMAINHKNGREAVTHYTVLKELKNNFSYICCQLETGRTHQIRVHMSHINHPLLGDDVYGPKTCPYKLQGQVLHAGVLGFVHPRTGEYVEFENPLPEYFEALLERLS